MELKIKKGVQEGRKGERNYRNVFSERAVPMAIAILTFWSAGKVSFLPYLHERGVRRRRLTRRQASLACFPTVLP
jgi:hypothetical protein